MKIKLLVITLIACISFSCQNKEKDKKMEMEKDADKFIEIVCKEHWGIFIALDSEFSTYSRAYNEKYKGDERIKFVEIIKEKINEKDSTFKNKKSIESALFVFNGGGVNQ